MREEEDVAGEAVYEAELHAVRLALAVGRDRGEGGEEFLVLVVGAGWDVHDNTAGVLQA